MSASDVESIRQMADSCFTFDDRTMNMTVKEFWEDYVKQMETRLENAVDDALDAIVVEHKQLREELKNLQHLKRLETAAKNKANARKQWDVILTVKETLPEAAEMVGKSFKLCPRVNSGGMCRIGRSTGETFNEPTGASLSFDASVSVWHGKITCVFGQVFYTDLRTRNGSKHNGSVVPTDTPVLLATGDELKLGDTRLHVKLEPVQAAADDENMAP